MIKEIKNKNLSISTEQPIVNQQHPEEARKPLEAGPNLEAFGKFENSLLNEGAFELRKNLDSWKIAGPNREETLSKISAAAALALSFERIYKDIWG